MVMKELVSPLVLLGGIGVMGLYLAGKFPGLGRNLGENIGAGLVDTSVGFASGVFEESVQVIGTPTAKKIVEITDSQFLREGLPGVGPHSLGTLDDQPTFSSVSEFSLLSEGPRQIKIKNPWVNVQIDPTVPKEKSTAATTLRTLSRSNQAPSPEQLAQLKRAGVI